MRALGLHLLCRYVVHHRPACQQLRRPPVSVRPVTVPAWCGKDRLQLTLLLRCSHAMFPGLDVALEGCRKAARGLVGASKGCCTFVLLLFSALHDGREPQPLTLRRPIASTA